MNADPTVSGHAVARWRERVPGEDRRTFAVARKRIRTSMEGSVRVPMRLVGPLVGKYGGYVPKRYGKAGSRAYVAPQCVFVTNKRGTVLKTVLAGSDDLLATTLVWLMLGHWEPAEGPT